MSKDDERKPKDDKQKPNPGKERPNKIITGKEPSESTEFPSKKEIKNRYRDVVATHQQKVDITPNKGHQSSKTQHDDDVGPNLPTSGRK